MPDNHLYTINHRRQKSELWCTTGNSGIGQWRTELEQKGKQHRPPTSQTRQDKTRQDKTRQDKKGSEVQQGRCYYGFHTSSHFWRPILTRAHRTRQPLRWIYTHKPNQSQPHTPTESLNALSDGQSPAGAYATRKPTRSCERRSRTVVL